jgi:hypothetical protein
MKKTKSNKAIVADLAYESFICWNQYKKARNEAAKLYRKYQKLGKAYDKALIKCLEDKSGK